LHYGSILPAVFADSSASFSKPDIGSVGHKDIGDRIAFDHWPVMAP
jgi:hypothetical protein